jgi:hypothetical protein
VSAQTFTYSAFANSLSSETNLKLANLASFTVSPITGSGLVWDASGLTQQSGTPSIHLIYATPDTTPNGTLFPMSNYAQYDPALTAFIDYQYFVVSSAGIATAGSYAPSSEHEIYNDTDQFMVFPFSLNDTFTDNYSKTNYSDATTISSFQTGSRTVSFAGAGSLILPQGTFNNVALIEDVRTNSLGPNSYKYVWWDLNSGKQLLIYSSNAGTSNLAYTGDTSLAVKDWSVSQNNISLIPNPAHSTLTIKNTLENAVTEVAIYNALGQKLYSEFPNSISSPVINVSGFSKGICFVTVKIQGKTYTSKLFIE